MGDGKGHAGAVERSQDDAHGEGHDYVAGSPHLRHATLRERIDGRIVDAIAEVLRRQGVCSVLEVGAGHGSFTDTVLNAGATATITEMSKASHRFLVEKFRDVAEVNVVYDVYGNAPLEAEALYDVILLISVVHHIPDYLGAITQLCDNVLRLGGIVVTFQDPVWYPRQTRWARAASAASYLAWRLVQGEIRRGLATRWRRLRGVYSDSKPSDLVEYHVVRQGVDDVALRDLLEARFAAVEFDFYFSTQSPRLQEFGEKRLPPNTFGVVARGYQRPPPPGKPHRGLSA